MTAMPVFAIEAPTGASRDAKQNMMKAISDALLEAFHFDDTRGWLREYPAENVSQDGRVGAEPIRPVVFLAASELDSLDAKRRLVQKIDSAIGAAYSGIANIEEVVVFFNEYPPHDVGLKRSVFSDKAEIVAALAQLNS
jgi:phenylpyruvate tautomerase PptA (4-oxalocrotonate tautomerase family)